MADWQQQLLRQQPALCGTDAVRAVWALAVLHPPSTRLSAPVTSALVGRCVPAGGSVHSAASCPKAVPHGRCPPAVAARVRVLTLATTTTTTTRTRRLSRHLPAMSRLEAEATLRALRALFRRLRGRPLQKLVQDLHSRLQLMPPGD